MCHWTILQTISDSILRSKHYKMIQIQNIAKQCEENNEEEKWQKLDILKSHQVRHMLDHDNGKRDFLKSTQRRKIWGKMDKNIWILWKNLMKKGSLMWEWLLDWLIMFWFLLQLLLMVGHCTMHMVILGNAIKYLTWNSTTFIIDIPCSLLHVLPPSTLTRSAFEQLGSK